MLPQTVVLWQSSVGVGDKFGDEQFRDMELQSRNDEIAEIQEKKLDLMKKMKEKEDNENILIAKVSSLESVKVELEKRVVRYGKVIVTLRKETFPDGANDENKFRKTLKDKNKTRGLQLCPGFHFTTQ